MSEEQNPTDESLTDVELDGVVGGAGTCTLHGGVATPHGEKRDDGHSYRCNGRGYFIEGTSGRG